jgi:hypothetical protein
VDVHEDGRRRTLVEEDVLESSAAPGFAMTVAEILGEAGD